MQLEATSHLPHGKFEEAQQAAIPAVVELLRGQRPLAGVQLLVPCGGQAGGEGRAEHHQGQHPPRVCCRIPPGLPGACAMCALHAPRMHVPLKPASTEHAGRLEGA